MRLPVFATAALVLLALGCSKPGNTTVTTNTPGAVITGSWKLALITGGFASLHFIPGPDQQKHITFRTDGTCTTTTTTDTVTAPYSLRLDSSISYMAVRKFVTIGDNNRLMYSFVHDSLTIEMDGIADGTTDWLIRE